MIRLAEALHEELNYLMRRRVEQPGSTPDQIMLVPMMKNQKQANRFLRIEVTHEIEDAIMEWNYRNGGGAMADMMARGGHPLSFMGVSVYVVNHRLPLCGWWIVNPFRPEA